MSIDIHNWVEMSIGQTTLENPSAECRGTFIPGDGRPGTLISGGHPSLLHRQKMKF